MDRSADPTGTLRVPKSLYRYRPLGDAVDRELSTLRDNYLYAASFASMNDPMEAFYETGGPSDWLVRTLLSSAGKSLDDIYDMVRAMTDQFALISFSSTPADLPLWAYYASNFGGMCLEFDTARLDIGDLQNEKLRPVTYAEQPLGPIDFAALAPGAAEEGVVARVSRKCLEWAHEKEWRYVTGVVGKKHYLDDALTRIFLGPRARPEHVEAICGLMAKRPVEVLHGRIAGYTLTFETIQPACPLTSCERTGAGTFDRGNDLYAEANLRGLLGGQFDNLVELCQRLSEHPNMESFAGIDLAGSNREHLYLWTTYRLRSGREVYHRQYFDRHFRPVSADA